MKAIEKAIDIQMAMQRTIEVLIAAKEQGKISEEAYVENVKNALDWATAEIAKLN